MSRQRVWQADTLRFRSSWSSLRMASSSACGGPKVSNVNVMKSNVHLCTHALHTTQLCLSLEGLDLRIAGLLLLKSLLVELDGCLELLEQMLNLVVFLFKKLKQKSKDGEGLAAWHSSTCCSVNPYL